MKGYVCECGYLPNHPISCPDAEWEDVDTKRDALEHEKGRCYNIADKRCSNLDPTKIVIVARSKNLIIYADK
jgi:hypothetical protein